jgi:hypothetical protein
MRNVEEWSYAMGFHQLSDREPRIAHMKNLQNELRLNKDGWYLRSACAAVEHRKGNFRCQAGLKTLLELYVTFEIKESLKFGLSAQLLEALLLLWRQLAIPRYAVLQSWRPEQILMIGRQIRDASFNTAEA